MKKDLFDVRDHLINIYDSLNDNLPIFHRIILTVCLTCEKAHEQTTLNKKIQSPNNKLNQELNDLFHSNIECSEIIFTQHTMSEAQILTEMKIPKSNLMLTIQDFLKEKLQTSPDTLSHYKDIHFASPLITNVIEHLISDFTIKELYIPITEYGYFNSLVFNIPKNSLNKVTIQSENPAQLLLSKYLLKLVENINITPVDGNALESPITHKNSDNKLEQLQEFDLVLYLGINQDKSWSPQIADGDIYQRFNYGKPSKFKNEFAYISQMLKTIRKTRGALITITTLGILFREEQESEIRRKMVEEQIIEAVITLPTTHTNAQVSILLFSYRKKNNFIYFADCTDSMNPKTFSNIVQQRELVNDISNIGSIENIRNNNYKLTPKLYTRHSQPNNNQRTTHNIKNSIERYNLLKQKRDALSLKLDRLIEKHHQKNQGQ